ncbi:hypothetical protein BKA83DRAFT_4489697 [Pisolithus microcarpus]|nr:hypothetical protein BKA83DRAFT_4489697 [Pisolithus microcarpus]
MVMGKLKPKPQDEFGLPLSTGVQAKGTLRRRIASFFVHDETSARDVSEDDVDLFPAGMSALWNAHQLLLATRPTEKSVVSKQVIFYAHGRDADINDLDNADVLPCVDLIVASLSKYFDGYATALGGSLVINPRMQYHTVLKGHLGSMFEDTYFDLDAIVLE